MLQLLHTVFPVKHKVLIKVTSYVVLISLLLCPVFAYADDDSSSDIPPVEEVSVEVLRISASQTSGFHAVILGLIGDYNPIVKDYTYQSTQGYTSHSIDIQPDWSWIASAFILALIIFCLFRFIGGVFSWKR